MHCFRCGWNGTKEQFERAIGTKLSFQFDKNIPPPTLTEYYIQEGDSITSSARAFDYLKSRGALEYAILNEWKCTPGKIIIPIVQYGICVGQIDRAYTGLLRYKNSEGLKSSMLMFNYDMAKKNDIIVLNEGIFDVISTLKALPFCGVMGLFGKSISCYNVNRLRSLNPSEIVLMLDSPKKDKQIQKSIVGIGLKLSGMKLSVATLPNSDPNESSILEIQHTFDTRVSFRL